MTSRSIVVGVVDVVDVVDVVAVAVDAIVVTLGIVAEILVKP